MIPLLALCVAVGWWLAGWPFRWGVLLTLATLALTWMLLAGAVYLSGVLVYGRTHHEAVAEAFRWPW